MHDVLNIGDMLSDELVQRRESGYDVSAAEVTVREALGSASPAGIERAEEALDKTELRGDWPYHEPSALEEIRASLPPTPDLPPLRLDEAALLDRLLGAWLGRCAGCNLGKPVEG